jgi:hypothetical protein
MGGGDSTPGALTGVSGLLLPALRSNWSGAMTRRRHTFFFTSEQACGGAMKPRKLAIFSAGDRGIPGHHVKPSPFRGCGIKTGCGERLA